MKLKIMLPKSLLAASATGLLALAAVLPARADYSNTVMSLGPVAYWRLNEPAVPPINYGNATATNSGAIGSAGDGLYYHSPTAQQPGALTNDPSVLFNGSNQYIEVPYNPVLNTNGPFSVEFWANETVVTTGAKSGVMSFSGNSGFLFYANNNDPYWGFRVFVGTTRVYVVDNATPILPNTWNHVVGVYDGTFVHIYVNGLESAASPLPIDIASTPAVETYVPNTVAPLRIAAGNPAGGASLFFPGWMDEVAMFPYALSSAQVSAHYQAATTNAPGYSAQILADNPSAYWRLNEPTLPDEPVATPNTVTNVGSWSAAADGTFYAGEMNVGTPGAPYPGFGTNNTAGLFSGGLTSYIEIPLQSVAPVPGLTVVCWAKRNGVSDFWNMIYSHPNDLGVPNAGVSIPVTGIGFGNSDNRNDQRGYYKGSAGDTGAYGWGRDPAMFMPNSEWTFLAMTVDGTTNMVIYQNGISATNNTAYGTHDFSTCASFIGRKQKYFGFGGGEVNGFKGTIDEVTIYDKALTKAEIAQIYAAAEPPPLILVQPVAPTPPVYEGTSLALSVQADEGLIPATYYWIKSGVPLTGQTQKNLTISALATTESGNYAAVVSNPYGSVTSTVAAVTVIASPPLITQQPQPATRYVGGTATFTVAAAGSVPLSYQWYFTPASTTITNAIPGATGSSYTVAEVQTGTLGLYSVRVSNLRGSTSSAAVALTQLPLGPGYGAEVAGSGAASYWRFNEGSGTTAYDYMGGMNGTNVGGVVLTPVGPRPPSYLGMENTNLAYTFNGTTEMVNLPKTFALNPSAYSVVVWVRADPQATNRVIIGQSFGGWALRLDSGNFLSLELVNGPSGTPLAGNMYVAADGLWHQAVAVYDGANEYLYVDGAFDVSKAASGPVANNGNLVTIGAQGAASPHWLGDLDEVAVYNRALSAAEIANLYQIATAGPAAPQIATEPVSQTVFAGQPVSFSVSATGGAPYTYQWYHAGTNLPAVTGRTLSIPSAYYTDAGTYSVSVNNSVGPITNSQVVSLTVLPPPTFANFTNDLVLHLKFDNNYADSSGRGNNGTAVGTLPGPTFVAGKIGGTAVHVVSEVDTTDPNALVCTNANYVTLGMPTDLQFGADTNFTVAYWVKMPAGEKYSEYPVLCDSIGGTFTSGIYFGTTWGTGGYTWWLGGASAGKVFESPADTINDGNWHHLVFSFDRLNNCVTYLDGVPVDSRSISGGGDVDVPGPWNIGQDATGTYPWSGVAVSKSECVIDDMGIWRRALSPTEAESIYIVGQSYARTFDKYGPVSITMNPPSANNGQSIELIWQAGTLQQSTNVTGPYLPVGGATAPYYTVKPGTGNKFYRVQL